MILLHRTTDPEGQTVPKKRSGPSMLTWITFNRRYYEAHRFLSERNQEITAEAIKNKVTGKGERVYMLMGVFKEHSQKMAALVGKEFSEGTLERYEISFRHTQEFLKSRYGIQDIKVKKVDHAFIQDYEFFLRTVRICANNSAVKYVNNFGKIIRICLSHGWITADPFANYKGTLKVISRVVLSEKSVCIVNHLYV